MAGDAEGVVYSATAIAARLGVAVETLRTWDRRYGVGPGGVDGRAPGGRRLYREADVARLLTMRRLVADGVPTAVAAREALAAVSAAAAPSAGSDGADPVSQAAAVRGLLRAATALDARSVDQLLTAALREQGVERTWDDLLRPALVTLGERWNSSGEGVEVEHVLSQVAGNALRAAGTLRSQELSATAPVRHPVLLAAVDGEQHILTLDALAALLAEADVPTMSLGASTPVAAVTQAVKRTRPAAIFLWARTASSATAEVAQALDEWRPASARRGLRIAVGGEGWVDVDLPAYVLRPASLGAARDALAGQ